MYIAEYQLLISNILQNNDTLRLFHAKNFFCAGNKYGGNFMPHPYAFLCGVTQMTQISFYFFTFLLLKVPEKLAGLKIKS